MPKVTMQDIADAVGTSRITVWKAFNHKTGVSESVRQQILRAAADMGYQKLPAEIFGEVSLQHKTVSLIVSRPETSIFWTNIIHEIAKEFSRHDIDLIYTYVPHIYQEGYTLPATLSNGGVSGCIILNVYDREILELINNLSIPRVFLDTTADTPRFIPHGDLILLEGRETIRILTDYIIRCGHTVLGFIGDIHYARTNFLRYEGFLDAMREHQLAVDPAHCLCTSLGFDSHEEQINAFLNSLDSLPQGFICVSDYTASVTRSCLLQRGLRVPEDIILTGYDGSMEPHNPKFCATVQVNTTALGQRLAMQLLYRIENPHVSKDTVLIESPIIYPIPCPRRTGAEGAA